MRRANPRERQPVLRSHPYGGGPASAVPPSAAAAGAAYPAPPPGAGMQGAAAAAPALGAAQWYAGGTGGHAAAATQQEEDALVAEAIKRSLAEAGGGGGTSAPAAAAGSERRPEPVDVDAFGQDPIQKGTLLAEGAQGRIYMCTLSGYPGEAVLKEMVCEDEKECDSLCAWALTIKHGVGHAGIVSYVHVDTPGGHVVRIVMPYYAGGDLANYIAGLTDYLPLSTILSWGAQMASALAALHKCTPQIVHKDIKPANVLLSGDRSTAVLTDLESSRAVGLRYRKDLEGTQEYLPPEALAGSDFTAAGDVWSLGVVLLCLIVLPPFPMLYCPREREEVMLNHRSWRMPELRDQVKRQFDLVGQRVAQRGRPAYPTWLADLVCSMLDHDPALRPSAAKVRDFMLQR
eukprot:TRINITY_DN97_c0_g2_i1.p2 TRINITY_DN97_c0_g2~~TRINITY_DN97_c0_g2_i1.p2  ORF type:complete len:433 (+),score=131.03 TRINITY_DN97_c0_g2_i1:91-1299(+)